jgi:catechol 2,3-dioxygenase-like lactoylglutathione lyase family enzyme
LGGDAMSYHRRVKSAASYGRLFAVCHHQAAGISANAEKRNPNWETSMSQVQVDQKSYQMPPLDGFTIAHFLTVADVERSLRFYEKVFDGRVLSRGDSQGAPGYIQIANTWLLVNPGGGPTPDKPTVTLSVPPDPDKVSSFMNIRVADIQACYKLWRSRGAEFLTEPIPKYGETRCYIRDPDGYIIEVGQSNPGVAYG